MLPLPSPSNARIITVAGKRCRLQLADGTRVEAIARGRLYDSGGSGIVVGDLVRAALQPEQWTVEEIVPRRNEYVREGLRKERQVMFANVDRLLIFASLSQPETKITSLDRFLLAALIGQVPAWLVLTKTDLDADNARELELRDTYAAFGVPITAVSNQTGEGVEALGSELREGVTALVGNSGVGKSSLMNCLIPGLDLRVKEVSAWTGKGVHTTTAALLLDYAEQAAIIDTPGMKSFTPYGVGPEDIIGLFPEISAASVDCRFRNCRHRNEPDCAVLNAADRGDIPAARLRSYYRLLDGLTTMIP
jgi:ribosome biogenesis GTPase / thiamine phosphate phosphatase